MASRVTSLDGLLVLRPFNINKIRSRPSEDSRKEEQWLECLWLKTVTVHGNDREKSSAQDRLHAQFNIGSSTSQISLAVEAYPDADHAREDAVQELDALQNNIDDTFSSSSVNGPQPHPGLRRSKRKLPDLGSDYPTDASHSQANEPGPSTHPKRRKRELPPP